MTLGQPGAHSDVTIATTVDDAWAPHFATCVASISASRGQESIRFVMLQGPTLSTAIVRELRAFVREHGMELEPIVIPADALASLPPTLLFSPLVWYRLLLPALLPENDRVLSLDADTLVMHSLVPLYERALGDHLLAAVAQPVTGSEERMHGLGLDPVESYFNAGVMLMNLEAMRQEDLGPRAIQLGHERLNDLIFAEQDALNVLCAGRWDLLSPKWNALSYLWLLPEDADTAYSDLERLSALASPAIIHFEGFQTVKPWFYRSIHPMRFLYRGFRAQTPWPLNALENRSVTGALLRTLPIRAQYRITRTKDRFSVRWPRG